MENYKPMKRRIFQIIEAIMAKRNCTTISCSLGEHQETLKLTKRATYVNNGINTDELDKMIENVEIMEHPFTVFTLGRICHQKNPKLFNEIAEAMPETRFMWIGEGELRDELKSKNVRITGWVDREKALQLSMNADVFLLTSLWEGLPISLLESMYMRKLCVVNDVIGNHDVISNEENGFVCRSVDEFTSAIKTTRRQELANRAHDSVLDDYSIAIMTQKYSKIYEDNKQRKTERRG